jgi:hypothetical protein
MLHKSEITQIMVVNQEKKKKKKEKKRGGKEKKIVEDGEKYSFHTLTWTTSQGSILTGRDMMIHSR